VKRRRRGHPGLSDFERRCYAHRAHFENDEQIVSFAGDEGQPLVGIYQQPMISFSARHVNAGDNLVLLRVDFKQLIPRLDNAPEPQSLSVHHSYNLV
jgi:hypothetical protein